MKDIRAIIVCVDYADLLEVTLTYNRHHFADVMVVTAFHDNRTISAVAAMREGVQLYTTNAFYENGAIFNKWKALEEGLDAFGREGWLCIMDADVLWPKRLPDFDYKLGYLYTPLRRMKVDPSGPIPVEDHWCQYPVHRNVNEWAGYSQIFHADDEHLPRPPWHETDWKHAGGADSFFQRMWPAARKVRPPFDCLHLGPAGTNWCGRVSPYLDGSKDPQAEERAGLLRRIFASRQRTRSFSPEKLPPGAG